MSGATKSQLQQMLANIKKDIQTIDEKGIYSLSYIFYNEGETRQRLLAQVAQIETELMYIADDEKRNKYKEFRDRDPLKKCRKKHTTSQ
jgi:Ribonuclease G/E